jgi:exocyst complex component 2
MVENAEKSVKKKDDDWTMEAGGLASPVAMVTATSIGAGTVNASDRVSSYHVIVPGPC